MQGIAVERAQNARQAAGSVGDDARLPRYLAGHRRAQGLESDVLNLPVTELSPIQDPATGNLYFFVDVSEIDGEDIIR